MPVVWSASSRIKVRHSFTVPSNLCEKQEWMGLKSLLYKLHLFHRESNIYRSCIILVSCIFSEQLRLSHETFNNLRRMRVKHYPTNQIYGYNALPSAQSSLNTGQMNAWTWYVTNLPRSHGQALFQQNLYSTSWLFHFLSNQLVSAPVCSESNNEVACSITVFKINKSSEHSSKTVLSYCWNR